MNTKMISGLVDRPENQRDILQRLTSGLLAKHKMKATAVAIEVLRMKASLVLLDGVFKDPSGEVGHDLREDIFAFIHDLRLLTATNLAKRSLQIVKCKELFK